MKTLSRYEFLNNRAFETRYLSPSERRQRGLPDCDTIALVTEHGQRDVLFLRADEALILARMLTDAVWKTCKTFEIGLLRHNGFVED